MMIRASWIAPAAILLLLGCGKRSSNEEPAIAPRTDPGPRSEVHIGGSKPDDWGHLSFTITAIHANQKPTREAPHHEPGGDWTFLDCRAENDPVVTFTVGVTHTGTSSKPEQWGRAFLATANREAGERFVNLFARAFRTTSPKPRAGGLPTEPLELSTAVLGINQERHSEGGFSGKAGSWVATKWFPADDDHETEVYFNYNLTDRVGEFSEKDPDYRSDLLAVFATSLRDGARPERTPETDPRLTREGPRIEHIRKITDKPSSYAAFTPDGQQVVYQDKTAFFTLSLAPEAEPFEIERFDHVPWGVHFSDDAMALLVEEGIPEFEGVRSSSDPMKIWWVDRKKKEKLLLRGPEKDLGLSESPLSPDGRYVVMQTYRDNPNGKGRYAVLFLLDRTSGKTRTVDIPGQSLSVTDWRAKGMSFLAIATANRWESDKALRKVYCVDPTTGAFEQALSVDATNSAKLTSPDGKYQARIAGTELVLTERDTGRERRFQFHEDDRRFVSEECVKWVSSRYLQFHGPRVALIDVSTGKMNYPAPIEKNKKFRSYGHQFSRDFQWVLYERDGVSGEGLQLGRVQMPNR